MVPVFRKNRKTNGCVQKEGQAGENYENTLPRISEIGVTH